MSLCTASGIRNACCQAFGLRPTCKYVGTHPRFSCTGAGLVGKVRFDGCTLSCFGAKWFFTTCSWRNHFEYDKYDGRISFSVKSLNDGTDCSSPRATRALGVDYGRRYIGLAVSSLGLAPRPLKNITAGGYSEIMRMARDVVEAAVAENCDAIVVGLPVTVSGSLHNRSSDSQQGRRCRNFADVVAIVAEEHGLNVFLANETGSTMEAMYLIGTVGHRSKKERSSRKDSVAAAIILSNYFENPKEAVIVRKSSTR